MGNPLPGDGVAVEAGVAVGVAVGAADPVGVGVLKTLELFLKFSDLIPCPQLLNRITATAAKPKANILDRLPTSAYRIGAKLPTEESQNETPL